MIQQGEEMNSLHVRAIDPAYKWLAVSIREARDQSALDALEGYVKHLQSEYTGVSAGSPDVVENVRSELARMRRVISAGQDI